MKRIIGYLQRCILLGCCIGFNGELTAQSTQQASNSLTLLSQRLTKLSDEDLAAQLQQKFAGTPLAPASLDALVARRRELVTYAYEGYRRGYERSFTGDVVVQTLLDSYQGVRTLFSSLPSNTKMGWVGAAAKAADIANAFEKTYKSLPQHHQEFYNEHVFKYTKPDYYQEERQRQWTETIDRSFQQLNSAAQKEYPATAQEAVNNVLKLSSTDYFKQLPSMSKPTNSGAKSTVSFAKAVDNFKQLDQTLSETIQTKANVMAQEVYYKEMSHLIAGEYKRDIGQIKQRLSGLERDLRNQTLSIEEIKKKQSEHQKTVLELHMTVAGFMAATQEQFSSVNDQLAGQQQLSTQLLEEMKQERLPLEGRVAELRKMAALAEQGKVTNLPLATIKEFLKRDEPLLEKQQLEQNIKIAQQAMVLGRAGLQFMQQHGIGSGFIQEMVSATLSANDIGISLAGGNYVGASLQVLSTLGVLKQQPSPEMQLLGQVQKQLSRLEQSVFSIDRRIQELHKQIYQNHLDLVNRLNFISEQMRQMRQQMAAEHYQVMVQLSDVNQRLNYLIQLNERMDAKLNQLLGKDIGPCYSAHPLFVKEVLDSTAVQLYTINDLNSYIGGSGCDKCLDGLDSFLKTNFVNEIGAFEYNQDPSEVSLSKSYLSQKDQYKLLKTYWQKQSADGKSQRVNNLLQHTLLYPMQRATEMYGPYIALGQDSTFKPKLTFENTFGGNVDYLNYKKVAMFAQYVLDFYPLLELYDNRYRRLKSSKEIKSDPIFVNTRTKELRNGLEKTLTLVEKAMAQQSLLMGNVVMYSLIGKLSSKDYVQSSEAIKLLRSNQILARNFASYLIAYSSPQFDSTISQYDDGANRFISLEKLIDSRETAQWLCVQSRKDGLSLKIQKPAVEFDGKGQFQFMTIDTLTLPLVQKITLTGNEGGGIKTSYVVDEVTPNDGMVVLHAVRERLKELLVETIMMTEQTSRFNTDSLALMLFYDRILDKVYDYRKEQYQISGARKGKSETDESISKWLSLSSNPVQNSASLLINWPANEVAELKVISLTGHVLLLKKVIFAGIPEQEILDTSSISPGVYVVQVVGNSGSDSIRLIKN